ncbi:MAG: hypothetical protein ACTHZ9_09980, partial [Leucobacter sp.]
MLNTAPDVDDLGIGDRNRSVLRWYLIVGAALVVAAVGGVSIGSVTVMPDTVVSIMGGSAAGVGDRLCVRPRVRL